MELDKKTLRYLFAGVAGGVMLHWILHEPERIRSVLGGLLRIVSPFLLGAALAFVLNVPMRGIELLLRPVKKDGLRRALAITVTLLAILLVLGLVLLLLIPQLITTINALTESLPDFFGRMAAAVTDFLEKHPGVREALTQYTDFENMDLSSLGQQVISGLTGLLGQLALGISGLLAALFFGAVDAMVSLIFGLYCLFRKEILANQGRRLLYAFLPENTADETVRILRMTNTTFSNFISGQCLEAVILGCMFAVSMAVLRMPFIPLVSLIIAVTALVPIVGSFVGCILGALFILVRDPMLSLWFIVLFLALQQIEGNLIYPRVVGASIGLPGMWVLVAVAVGGDLFGVGGMLLMIPLVSVLYALIREVTQRRLSVRAIPADKLMAQASVQPGRPGKVRLQTEEQLSIPEDDGDASEQQKKEET